MKNEPHGHQRIYELDWLRSVTALCVIATHVLFFTAALNQSGLGTQVQQAIVTSFHFAREMFMFVAAFALVYIYYGRPFSFKRFWTKRGLGVLVPYCIWSAIYVWTSAPFQSPGAYVRTTIFDILTGNASYQLYFILLSLQFYALLPLLLRFLKRVRHHPWKVLIVSFVMQVILLSFSFYFVQKGTFGTEGIWQVLAQYQDRFVFTYQFYFILGAFAAIYRQQVCTFLLHHSRLVIGGAIVAMGALWGHYFLEIRVFHESIAYASTALQPIMALYCPAMMACLFWWSIRWARQRGQEGYPRGYGFWRSLSNASFGIYLIHPLILTGVLRWIVPALSPRMPVAFCAVFAWLLTTGGAAMMSIVLLKIPMMSRLVGRSHTSLPDGVLQVWFRNRLNAG